MTYPAIYAAASNGTNLKGAWDSTLKSIITSAIGTQTFVFITAIGVLLIVGAFITWAWQKRKGQGANMQALTGAAITGIVLAAPMVLIPIVLLVIDKIAAIVLGLAGKIG